jgi:hypothetical protein
MNVAPHEKDADKVGIRKRLTLTKAASRLREELPSQTEHERQELREIQSNLGLVDAFEHQRDSSKGRDASARDRYSQYSHGNRGLGHGQRVDLILTDIPMKNPKPGGAVVLDVRVLTEEQGSDHLPVEASFHFATIATVKASNTPSTRALGSPKVVRPNHADETKISYAVGDRILVNRSELTSVAASEQRPWIPATVKEIQGQLVRVRTDTHWLHPQSRQEQGVRI